MAMPASLMAMPARRTPAGAGIRLPSAHDS